MPQGGGQGLAAQDQGRGSGQLQQAELHQHPRQRRCGVEDVDPVLGQSAQKRERVPGDRGVVDVHRVPAEEPRQLVQCGVEREGRRVRHMQVVRVAVALGRREEQRAVVGDQVTERGTRDFHALGAAGGSGGVQQVGQVLGFGDVRDMGRGRVPVDVLPQDAAGLGAQGGIVVGVRDDDVRAAVLGGRTTPFGRVRAVQGLERAARPEGGQHGHDHLVAAGQVEDHHALGRDARLREQTRQDTDPAHEFRASEAGARVHQDGFVRTRQGDVFNGLGEVHGREVTVVRARPVGRRATPREGGLLGGVEGGDRTQLWRVGGHEAAQ